MKIGYYSFVAVLTQVFTLSKVAAGAKDHSIGVRNEKQTNLGAVYLKLELKKNESKKWTPTFAALKVVDDSKQPIHLDIQTRTVKCGSREYHYAGGILKGADVSSYKMFSDVCIQKLNLRPDPALELGLPPRNNNIPPFKAGNLRFHSSGGKNLSLRKGGLKAHRIRPGALIGNAGVLTNRPLMNNEMFEVKLEDHIETWEYISFGIGVTTLSPSEIKYAQRMSQKNVWILYGDGVFFHENRGAESYGVDLRNLKVGDTIGVVRNSDGNVHFYENGRDMGLAIWGAPGPLYGVLDLYGDRATASIVPLSVNDNDKTRGGR